MTNDKFVKPKYCWELDITSITPSDEQPPVLLVRDGREIKSYDFTHHFLIERMGIDPSYFVPNPKKPEAEEQSRISNCRRIYTAQFVLQQLADKDFILSDRTFKQNVRARPYGLPDTGFHDAYAATTIGTDGHFLSFFWKCYLSFNSTRDEPAKIEERSFLNFHNLEIDLARPQGAEEELKSDRNGQKYLGCLESALEICKKTEEVPYTALMIMYREVSAALSGRGWTPAIFHNISHREHSPHISLSLDVEQFLAVKEAYSRLSGIKSTLKEIIDGWMLK